MDVVEAILIILALKIPIVGLLFWVYMLMKDPAEDPEPETVRSKMPPRLPEPGEADRANAASRWRRRGPPSPRRGPCRARAATAQPGCATSTRNRSGTCFSVDFGGRS